MRTKWYISSIVVAVIAIGISAFIALGQVGSVKELKYKALDYMEQDKVPYYGILSDCRLLASPACISRFTALGYQKLHDPDRKTYLTAEDIITRSSAQYTREDAINLYQEVITLPPNVGLVTTDTGEVPFYEIVINESLRHNIHPDLMLVLMRMTGAARIQMETYPAVFNLGQSDVQTETKLLANAMQEAYQRYDVLVREGKYAELKKRFTTRSIDYAVDVHLLNAASLAYLDVITQFYGKVPYYGSLVDIHFTNPKSFRNIYIKYAAGDPRTNISH